MSFREKSAWITFILLLVVFGFYFASYGVMLASGGGRVEGAHPNMNVETARTAIHAGFSVLFGLLVAAFVIAEIVLHIIVAIRARAEANAPADERERLIALKAKRLAYQVLVSAAWGSMAVVFLGVEAWVLANAIFFAIWLGELTNYGTQIYLYRRGA
jgi:Ca2+/Na+ antiporter